MEQKIKTNRIEHIISRNDKIANCEIRILLADDCKNGHQDFSITSMFWEVGKKRNDKNFVYGGCAHDEILKLYPSLQIFVNLHLCDYKGVPMFPIDNMQYLIQNNPEEITNIFIDDFCKSYRISKEQFNVLEQCDNRIQFALAIKELGILGQWEHEAKTAIKQLESWTNSIFVIDSISQHYKEPSEEEIIEEQIKQNIGYYSKEEREKRVIEYKKNEIKKLNEKRDKNLKEAKDKINKKYDALIQVLEIGGKKALDNLIYYDHIDTINFNWRKYDNIKIELIEKIKSNFTVKGVAITIDGK